MISTTAAILYFVAVAVTAVSIVAALSALRAARRLEDQMLRWEEAARTTPHPLSRDGISSTESRLFLE
jgi:hypothetical protein